MRLAFSFIVLTSSFILAASAFAADPPAPVLPQFASASDIKIIWQENASTGHGEILRLRFETKRSFNGHASDGVSQFFEKQLAAAGWHQSEADTSNEVFVSAWQNGQARLLMSILQLNAQHGDYFAAFEIIR